jgi:hypothetical protein
VDLEERVELLADGALQGEAERGWVIDPPSALTA